MIRRLTTFFLTAVALVPMVTIVCLAQSQLPLTRHVREVTSNGQAQMIGRVPATNTMRLTLVLPLRNQAQLDQLLKDLYDRTSSSFHQFLTVPEFTELFGPTQKDYNSVISWAKTSGLAVAATSRNRVTLDVTGSVETIERALNVTMGIYQHPSENRTFYAPDREPTPNLPFRAWHIAGLDNYSIPRPALVRRSQAEASQAAAPQATTGSCPEQSFCGSDMRAAYYQGTALTGAGQSLGLLEFFGTDLDDLKTYYANIGQTNNVPITLLSTDGTSTSCVFPACDDTEQTLDMTQALGMAPGLTSLVVYVGSTDPSIFNAMATAEPLNAQLSSSWSWFPADPNTDNPFFQEFAAQGQNLFQASGDNGAWNSASLIFPADDPFLTSVGGTDLMTSAPGGPWSSETAWIDGGGGISPDLFAIPYWQTTTVSSCSDCSPIFRNGPDVSANADFTFYVCADQQPCTTNFFGGTSFAAPMWAGYLALVNEQAVAKSGHTVGFINPVLYNIGLGPDYAADLHDITSGTNGISATVGYDPATGWGSPNSGTGLIDALMGSDFFLSASPASLTVSQGNSGTYTATLTSLNGLSGAVDLSISCPSGMTCAFSPQTVTVSAGGTATSTLTVTPTTTPEGTYTLTITATSGSLTRTASINVVVIIPRFSLSATPSATSVNQGRTAKYTATFKSISGFNNSVTLSATGCPPGSKCSFSPDPVPVPSGGSATSVFSVATKKKTTPAGSYSITITGTSGSLQQSVTLLLTVFGQ
ncbi:MAG: hypothetical protein J2P13_01835 [Acidobacteria bacterium]|nr:hypothetical protein [Acidobacteriota bacterium]